MQRLVLFDIDGTLLASHGEAARAFREALAEVYGTDGPEAHSFAGKTDPQLVAELLGAHGVEPSGIDAHLPRFWGEYLTRLEARLAQHPPRVLPGVPRLLDALAAAPEAAVLGLLTGNLQAGARLKLAAAGLRPERFRVGAYGSDHAARPELPAIAVARAEAATGRRFRGKEVVIIGDTPADIACGAHLGVRTLAVATGPFGVDDLAAHHPDALFPSLEDFDAVWAAILAPG